mgnify:CR=1 FL=1
MGEKKLASIAGRLINTFSKLLQYGAMVNFISLLTQCTAEAILIACCNFSARLGSVKIFTFSAEPLQLNTVSGFIFFNISIIFYTSINI